MDEKNDKPEGFEVLAAVIVAETVDEFEQIALGDPDDPADRFVVATVRSTMIGAADAALAERWRALTRELIGDAVRRTIGATDARLVHVPTDSGHAANDTPS